MVTHTTRAFDSDLQKLTQKIDEMGRLVERQVVDAMAALVGGNTALAGHVVESDDAIDVLQRDIEEQAVATIACRQPMAIDLREIVGAMRIASDLERIGDLAGNIANESLMLGGGARPVRVICEIEPLARLVIEELRHVLDSYMRRDVEEALAVWHSDAKVDALYSSLFAEILGCIRQTPDAIVPCVYLLLCAKNLERIGDHSTNIAETLHYIVVGHVIREARPKADTTCQPTPSSQA